MRGLALIAAKAAALVLLRCTGVGYAEFDARAVEQLTTSGAWALLMVTYLAWTLTLSAAQDVTVVVARLLGFPLPNAFRWVLLAWNPVELWRRWGIYNRKLLLTLVYFPLGGARRRYVNVMLTFLASAVLLHSGWVGSVYIVVGVPGVRDQIVYFAVQGAAVCACLGWWRWRGKDPRKDGAVRWSWGRLASTLAMQAFSAWVHALVLAQAWPWAARTALMARALGL